MNAAHEGVTPNPLPGSYVYRNAEGYDPNAATPQTIYDVINGGGVPGGVAGQPWQALDGRWYQQGLNGQTYEVAAPTGAAPAGVAPAGAICSSPVYGTVDRYNPTYDPRYDPTTIQGAAPAGCADLSAGNLPPADLSAGDVPAADLPPAGLSGYEQVPPGQVGNGQVVLPPTGVVQPPVQQPVRRPGFFRRLFGG